MLSESLRRLLLSPLRLGNTRRAPESINGQRKLDNAGRHFRQIAVLVYEALLEAEVNPNYDVHSDLQKTLEVLNEVLNVTYKLVKEWSVRMGMASILEGSGGLCPFGDVGIADRPP